MQSIVSFATIFSRISRLNLDESTDCPIRHHTGESPCLRIAETFAKPAPFLVHGRTCTPRAKSIDQSLDKFPAEAL